MPAYNFDADDMQKIAEHLTDDAPAPTFAEVSRHWLAPGTTRMGSHGAVADRIAEARAEHYAKHGPTKYRIQGDWMTDGGLIDNDNRRRSVMVYRDAAGRWWADDDRWGAMAVKAVAYGDDAPLLACDPTAGEDAAGMVCWSGNFCPDGGELRRIGMMVEAI